MFHPPTHSLMPCPRPAGEEGGFLYWEHHPPSHHPPLPLHCEELWLRFKQGRKNRGGLSKASNGDFSTGLRQGWRGGKDSGPMSWPCWWLRYSKECLQNISIFWYISIFIPYLTLALSNFLIKWSLEIPVISLELSNKKTFSFHGLWYQQKTDVSEDQSKLRLQC
jgi:hypothetical protein